MDMILQAENIRKIYGPRENPTIALKNVSIGVEEGSFTAIIGKSGSGKSTLLKVLSGLDRPTEGRVLLQGEDLRQLPDQELTRLRRRKIGFIYQEFNLLPEFTVEENIKLPLFFDDREPDQEYIVQLMELLGLLAHKDKLPQQLSGGEQQRTAIARALAIRPAIVFADEPTGNLDSVTSGEVLELFLLSRRILGQTLILATHDLDLAERADRVLTLRDGVFTQDRRSKT